MDADITLKLDKPEQRVIIDRERAADLGVRTEDIATTLRLVVGGDEQVSRFRDESANENYDVQLRLIEADRSATGRSRSSTCRAAAGAAATSTLAAGALGHRARRQNLVRLDSLVRIEPALSPSRIDRLGSPARFALRAGVAPGYAPRTGSRRCRRRPTSWTCPPATAGA